MSIRISRLLTVLLFLSALSILSACTPEKGENPPAAEEPVTIRLAVLPILDTLPMYVAEKEGLFAERNLIVEFIPVASAPERDQVIAAKKADAMINELVSTALYNQEKVQIQVVRFARTATAEQPVFRILAAANSGIETVEDLKSVAIGISEGTVIEYLTDRLLQAEGFNEEDIATVAVPKIPDRLALLGSGEIKAAMLPDPLSSLAIQNGARVILDDTSHPEYGYSVLSFTKAFATEHPEALRAFLAAYEEAVERINANPEQYADLLTEKQLVPPPVLGAYKMPVFPTAAVPTQEQWDDVIAWLTEEGLLSGPASYAASVTAEFLP